MRERLGVTSVVITHDMRSAYTVGSRIAMLYQGRVQQVGTVDEIRNTRDPIVRQFIEGRPSLDDDAPAAQPAAARTPSGAQLRGGRA
jgi:phospholipid/cholesterol/gamma-HCH transport system ATP-binding protein